MLSQLNLHIERQIGRFFASQSQAEQLSISPRVFWAGFALIALAGGILRFWDLSSVPLWRDEAVTLGLGRLDLWTILSRNVDNHPPLAWVIQHFWMAINPDTSAARVPAATAGTLTVILFMLAIRDIAGARAALFAGLLFAFSTGHIHYSQDARMYPFLVLGLTLAAWGAIGHIRPGTLKPRTYALLYVLGGAIAIYSHLMGLVAMGMIGLPSLALGLIGPEPRRFFVSWLVRNIVLFVIVLPWLVLIPSALSTFPGLAPVPVTHAHWYFRNIAGLPGLDKLGQPIELILLASAAFAIPLAWVSGRRSFAGFLLGLMILYPLIIMILHARPGAEPVLSNRAMTPVVICVAAGAGYALSMLKSKLLGTAVMALVAAAALGSSIMGIRHNVKLDDTGGAHLYLDQQGYSGATVLTCDDFYAAAAWENRPSARILFWYDGDVVEYHGPQFWQAAGMSMVKLRAATLPEIDAYLGGGWLVPGGLDEAMNGVHQAAIFNTWCQDMEDQLITELQELGFERQGEDYLVRGKAADYTIMQAPETRVILFERPHRAEMD